MSSTYSTQPSVSSSNSIPKESFEGQLSKFTNVVKGWQYRWFVLSSEAGRLDYYLLEDWNLGRPPRGSQHLSGALVMPSDEDDKCFLVSFNTGEVYKLRAANVRERQIWVDKIRAVIAAHEKAIAESLGHQNQAHSNRSHFSNGEPSIQLQNLSLSVLDAFGAVQNMIRESEMKSRELCKTIETFPLNAQGPRCVDTDLLMMKATSNAAVLSLQDGLSILQDYRELILGPSATTYHPHISKSVFSTQSGAAAVRESMSSYSPRKSASGSPSRASVSRLSTTSASHNPISASTHSLPAELKEDANPSS